MQQQQKADGELMQVYAKLVALILLLIVLAILGFRYLGSVQQVSAQGLVVEHTRLLNVLGMIKAQWLAKGRPEMMRLDWQFTDVTDGQDQQLVKINRGGWPTVNNVNESSCEQLWQQLLGGDTHSQQIVIEVGPKRDVCSYIANNNDRISYQLTSGRVIFLTNEEI
ncbi:hypothetical protein FLM48_19610 [Shewanella sp. Scap07]|uniref:hypothetical protein n=1 Tax=Shewanella sp. Scap07 TaxID=2589987 RepID=UPI0015C166DA|nr:hypothetical protein [Shewanella sp. Scap07]QLE87085.1 hypothetical protein FLM48_19610 [Shewanella sp. Scap07]